MTCPECQADVDVSHPIGNVVICPSCLSSLAITGDTLRRARAEDTTVLSDDQIAQLKAQRAAHRKAHV